jgi:transcription initiation factor IIE alpha subunit
MEMGKALPAVMTAMFGLVMIVAVADVAQAMTPQPQYVCPICGQKFYTYDELYQHFTTEHPSEPIDIIWE